MRKWRKYLLEPSIKGRIYLGRDETFDDHAKAMGGYNPDESYTNKTAFLNKYFWGYHYGRLENYDNFIRKYLSRNGRILSIASGRCTNELFLMEDGYLITCSDLGIFTAYRQTKALFPQFDFIELNILKFPPPKKYDAIISLSLIYLFNEIELNTFFENISDGLETGGHLILDSAGSPDNFFSFFIHDIWLKYETFLVLFLKLIFKREVNGIIIKNFGFRRTDKEIIESAKRYNLELVVQENYAFITEFTRSRLFSKFLLKKAIKSGSILNCIFSFLGKKIPYIRMYKFKKVF